MRERLREALADAEIPASPDDALAVWLAGTAAVTLVAAALARELAVVAAPAALLAGPCFVGSRRQRRSERLRDEVPEILDEVARDLRAGSTIGAALERLAAAGGDYGEHLGPYRDARSNGSTVVEAVTAWARSHDDAPPWLSTPVAGAAAALVIAIQSGGRAAYALEGIAEAIRSEADASREARAQGAQGRASAAVLAGLAPASLAVGAALDPETVRVLLTHPLGNVAFVGGLSCELLGVWWMRRILRVR